MSATNVTCSVLKDKIKIKNSRIQKLRYTVYKQNPVS